MSGALVRRAVATDAAPPPAGTYSQAIACGGLLFVSGQTPRLPDGTRIGDAPFEQQVRQALDNLAAVVAAGGGRLEDAVKVTVFLSDPSQAAAFDAIYREHAGSPPAARALVQSDLPGFAVEVDAIVALGAGARAEGE